MSEFVFNYHVPTAMRIKFALRDIHYSTYSELPSRVAETGICGGNEAIISMYLDRLLSSGEVVVTNGYLSFPEVGESL